MPNIKEIAKQLGVSIATVSRAMQPKTQHLVKKETQEKIFAAVDKAGYFPNKAASNLVQKKSGILALAIPYFVPHLAANDYFSLLVAGVMEQVIQSDYELKFILIPEGTLNETQLRLFRSRGVDGLILAGWPTFPQFNEILKIKIPLMIINDFDKKIPANFVYADHFQGGYLAGKYLIEQGYRKIGVTISKPEWFPDMNERLKGFKKALKEEGIALRLISSGVTEESGYTAMLKVLQKKEKLQALFFMNDVTAIGAQRALKDKGVSCPKEIAIMGYDDIRLGEYVSPALTTIHQPIFELGQEATRLLIQVIEKKVKQPIRTKLSVKLVIRKSCGGLKGA